MQCPACRHENRAGRRHCGGCGAALPAICPSCGQQDEDGERFCAHCGAELATRPGGSTPPPVPARERALREAARLHRANGEEWLATQSEARIAAGVAG
jgi:hypothetical protein